MFLHLGNDHMVEIKNIVAILDIEYASTSRITKEFLSVHVLLMKSMYSLLWSVWAEEVT